jgi:hypothetical protein
MQNVTGLFGITAANNNVKNKPGLLHFHIPGNNFIEKVLQNLGFCSESKVFLQNLDTLNKYAITMSMTRVKTACDEVLPGEY